MPKRLIRFLVVAGIAGLAAACGGDAEPTPTRTQPASPPPPEPAPVVAVVPDETGSDNEGGTTTNGGTPFTVTNRDLAGSGEYEFDPAEMSFTVGETVTFTIIGETEYHTFTVDALGIDEAVDASEEPGASATFTHTFDQAGTFPLICLVHELDGMVGTITVVPNGTDSPSEEGTTTDAATPVMVAGTSMTVTNRDLAGSGVYEFDPAELSFTLGETVNFTIIGETEYHTFTVGDLGIDEEVDASENPGAEATFTYTFDQAGEFPLVCLVHELDGMVGTITVSE